MTLPLDFHPAVRDEVENAHDWYAQHDPGLGADFLDELERLLSKILANPARYGFADGDIREGSMNRFPYIVYYRKMANRIRILSVCHTARDPLTWQSRK